MFSFKGGKGGPDEDDLMVQIRGDGNIIFDSHVRQDLGMLHSDKLGQSLTRVDQIPLWTWPRGDDVPIKTKGAFVYDSDPPPPQHIAEVMNHILPEAYRATLAGNSFRQRRKRRNANLIKGGVATVVILSVLTAFVILPLLEATGNTVAGNDNGGSAEQWQQSQSFDPNQSQQN
ncbi:MAG: hypothetical protein F4Z14_06595 [Gammaproteobacteria bacterium]|nr:hypothetical protein [Gammaproteobacteria bacterium]